jgi:hypothetical protein
MAFPNIELEAKPAFAVLTPVVIVRVLLAVPEEGLTVAGENPQVAFAGRPLQLNVTVELNPLNEITVTTVVAVPLSLTVRAEEPSDKLKSEAPVTVRVAAAETDAAFVASPP